MIDLKSFDGLFRPLVSPEMRALLERTSILRFPALGPVTPWVPGIRPDPSVLDALLRSDAALPTKAFP